MLSNELAEAMGLTEEPYDYYRDYKNGTITKAEYDSLVRDFEARERKMMARSRAQAAKKGANSPQAAALKALIGKRANSFISSILSQVERGKPLSDAQKKAVRKNLYRSRMKPQADLFR